MIPVTADNHDEVRLEMSWVPSGPAATLCGWITSRVRAGAAVSPDRRHSRRTEPWSVPLLRILGTGTRIAGGSSRAKIHSGSVNIRAADRSATMATTPSIVAIPCTTARLTSPVSKYRRVRSADEPGTMTIRAGTVIEGHDGRHGQYV